jgi:hypothetical protein
MKESILTRVTRRPLASPTAAPMRSTAATAACHGQPWAWSPIASTCEMPTLKPVDGSNWFATIGMKTESATRSCTDLLLRMERMLK